MGGGRGGILEAPEGYGTVGVGEIVVNALRGEVMSVGVEAAVEETRVGEVTMIGRSSTSECVGSLTMPVVDIRVIPSFRLSLRMRPSKLAREGLSGTGEMVETE